MKLKDRVAVVTGSSMGIGEAIAWSYAREGARLVLHSRSQERAERVGAALRAKGHDAVSPISSTKSTKSCRSNR